MYHPSFHIPLSKGLAENQAPLDAKLMYYTNGDGGVFAYRPFQNLDEVRAYFPLEFRQTEQGTPLAFPILVNTGGTLSPDGSSISGGRNTFYAWVNGVGDGDLEPYGIGYEVFSGTNEDVSIIVPYGTGRILYNKIGGLYYLEDKIFIIRIRYYPYHSFHWEVLPSLLFNSEVWGLPNPIDNIYIWEVIVKG